ncbi:hypothetical protein M9H77_09071 [Catharanthus roseus]|uniref:Uncharacterized protein n=1 Tax=Catharanthus roseus TaxID=4058 RepID=A0ACC0BZL8_CATRO|nr:hypothetical protein M9H77_09071 [Catharanthus roseus]
MDPEQRRHKDTRLSPVVDRSGRTHGRTVTASSRGLRGRHSTSNVPTTPPHGMFHGLDTPGSSVPLPPIPTRVRMPYDPHIPGGNGDETIIQAVGDGEGKDVVRAEIFKVRRRGIKVRRRRIYMYRLQGKQGE